MTPVLDTQVKRILLTNDDGYNAPGLCALAEALKDFAEVSIVAPSRERSGAAQSLTLRQPIVCERAGERHWAVDGTPADCVIVALHKLLPQKPDLVISGINHGANLGENIYYSGTVGAAREAALHQVPALAVSLCSKAPNADFSASARLARSTAEAVLREGLPGGVDRRGSLHAAIEKDHAQSAQRGQGSAGPELFLAHRAENRLRRRAGHGLCRDFWGRCFRDSAAFGSHASSIAESPFTLGQNAGRGVRLEDGARARTNVTRYDVAVIGAGVFGAWTAWHLARRGRRVLLLEACGPAHSRASSGGETRIIRMGYGTDEIYTRWSQKSLEQWKAFFAESNQPLFLRTGVLWLAGADDTRLRCTQDALRRCGIPFETLDRRTLGERYPQMGLDGIETGIFEPESGVLLARRAVAAV